MKIGILITKYPPRFRGGAETQAELLARYLSVENEVTLFTRMRRGEVRHEKKDGYNIVRIPYVDFPVIRFISYCISAFFVIEGNKSNIDILHCFMLTPNGFIGSFIRRYLKIPVVSGIRGGDWYFSKDNFFSRLFVKIALEQSDCVLVQTKSVADDVLKEVPNINLTITPNMVEKSGISLAHKEYDVIFVGNLFKRKGIDNLIKAAKSINGTVCIVGEGSEKKHIECLIKKYDLSGKVYLKDRIRKRKVLKEISKAKVLVLPSIAGEGMPNVILEAYSVGVPVVASSIAGIPDIVVDGKTGYLVRSGDVLGLAEKINYLLEDDRYRLMKEDCIKFASKYYPEKIVPKIENIYKRFV